MDWQSIVDAQPRILRRYGYSIVAAVSPHLVIEEWPSTRQNPCWGVYLDDAPEAGMVGMGCNPYLALMDAHELEDEAY